MDFKEQLEEAKGKKVEEYVALRRENPDQITLEIEARFGFEHFE